MKAIINLFAAAILVAAFSACNEPAKQGTEAAATTPVKPATKMDHADISKSYTAYIDLKNKLVAGNVKGAQKAATDLAANLQNIMGCSETATVANKIAAADSIETQRADFSIVSSDMITLVKNAKVKGLTAYVDYCPMANNGKGSHWLSESKDIRNPFYGTDMMECGEVKETLVY